MRKEEEGEPGPPDQRREFIDFDGESSLRRGTLVTTRRRGGRARIRAWVEAIGSEERLKLAPLLCISQSAGFGCTYFSESARLFVSWTALTPLRVESNVSGPGRYSRPRFPLSRGGIFPRIIALGLRIPPGWCDPVFGPERRHWTSENAPK